MDRLVTDDWAGDLSADYSKKAGRPGLLVGR